MISLVYKYTPISSMFPLVQGILLYYANIYLNRTGVIYEIIDGKVVPWVILSDGPGNQTKVKSSC